MIVTGGVGEPACSRLAGVWLDESLCREKSMILSQWPYWFTAKMHTLATEYYKPMKAAADPVIRVSAARELPGCGEIGK